jgi:predicted nucleotidyltransferase component of viral defense system
LIPTPELHREAATQRLRFDQVEKDYVILWVLKALAQSWAESPEWIFKGGTCLRHCYYPGYRFSEDIDFSCHNGSDNVNRSVQRLEVAALQAQSESGLTLAVKPAKWSAGQEQLEIGIEYSRGGARRQALPAVIVHLTFDEPILAPTATRDVTPPYSDLEAFGVACYSKLEIVAEKLRALLQQQEKWPRPRDLYDVWFILCQQREPVPTKQLRELFEAKCAVRGITPDPRHLVSINLQEWNRAAWHTQLLPTLDHGPDYDRVWSEWTAHCATLL